MLRHGKDREVRLRNANLVGQQLLIGWAEEKKERAGYGQSQDNPRGWYDGGGMDGDNVYCGGGLAGGCSGKFIFRRAI
jgi:hypothetical protein